MKTKIKNLGKGGGTFLRHGRIAHLENGQEVEVKNYNPRGSCQLTDGTGVHSIYLDVADLSYEGLLDKLFPKK